MLIYSCGFFHVGRNKVDAFSFSKIEYVWSFASSSKFLAINSELIVRVILIIEFSQERLLYVIYDCDRNIDRLRQSSICSKSFF